ncbi:MAG: hypothetical protein AB7O50_09605 [Pseudolabrys sp.]
MLRLLTKPRRFWTAAIFAVAYAVCALVPSAVLAFSGHQNSAHCFGARASSHQSAHIHNIAVKPEAAHHGTAPAHDHAAHGHAAAATGEQPENTAPGATHALPTSCCGIFCVSALTPLIELTAVYAPLSANFEAPVTGFMSGQDPSRIDRPPRSLVLI